MKQMRFRFSLRLLLILFTLVAILFGGAAHLVYREKEKVWRHKVAAQKLRGKGINLEPQARMDPSADQEGRFRQFVRSYIDRNAYPSTSAAWMDFTPGHLLHIRPSEALDYLRDIQCLRDLAITDLRMTKEIATQISELPDLESLRIAVESIDGDSAPVLGRMHNLEVLLLLGLPVEQVEQGRGNDDVVKAVSTLPQLRVLRLLAPGLTDSGLSSLGNLKKLEVLELCQIHFTPQLIESLEGAENLSSLYLDQGDFEAGASYPFGKLDRLTRLIIGEMGQVPDELFAELAKLPELEELNVSGGPLRRGEHVQRLLACKRLIFLHLNQTSLTDDDLQSLASHPSLQDVTYVGDLSLESIRKFLSGKPGRRVRQLSQANSYLGSEFMMDGDELRSHPLSLVL